MFLVLDDLAAQGFPAWTSMETYLALWHFPAALQTIVWRSSIGYYILVMNIMFILYCCLAGAWSSSEIGGLAETTFGSTQHSHLFFQEGCAEGLPVREMWCFWPMALHGLRAFFLHFGIGSETWSLLASFNLLAYDSKTGTVKWQETDTCNDVPALDILTVGYTNSKEGPLTLIPFHLRWQKMSSQKSLQASMASTITPSLHGYQAFHGFLVLTSKPAMAFSHWQACNGFFLWQAYNGFVFHTSLLWLWAYNGFFGISLNTSALGVYNLDKGNVSGNIIWMTQCWQATSLQSVAALFVYRQVHSMLSAHKKNVFENVFKRQEPISSGNVPNSESKKVVFLSRKDRTIYSQRLQPLKVLKHSQVRYV